MRGGSISNSNGGSHDERSQRHDARLLAPRRARRSLAQGEAARRAGPAEGARRDHRRAEALRGRGYRGIREEGDQMTTDDLVKHAVTLLEGNALYLADAKRFAPGGNSIVGALLSIRLSAPRELTEQAVCAAVQQLAAAPRRATKSTT